MKSEQISNLQFTIVTAFFTFGTSILMISSLLTIKVRQDAWIASIIGMLVNVLFILLYIVLIRMYPQLTLIQIIEVILGKWLGKLVSCLYLLFFFILTVYLVRFEGSFIVSAIFPETPLVVILITFTFVVALAVRYGPEVFCRSAELFTPFLFLFFICIFLSLLPKSNLELIQPVFEYGTWPILSTGIQAAAIQEHICLLMLVPYVRSIKRIPSAFLIGAVIGSVVIILITTFSILVLGPDVTARNLFPGFTLAKKITIGRFLERLESIMIAIWFLAVFIKTTICYYALSLGLAQTTSFRNYRTLVYPLGISIAVYAGVVFPNIAEYLESLHKSWFPYSYTMLLIIPLLLLALGMLKKYMANKA